MSFKSGGGDELNAEINVTPMVDVMLVLLIIFMVITPMLQQKVAVDMAKVENPTPMPDADKPLVPMLRELEKQGASGKLTNATQLCEDAAREFIAIKDFLAAQPGLAATPAAKEGQKR